MTLSGGRRAKTFAEPAAAWGGLNPSPPRRPTVLQELPVLISQAAVATSTPARYAKQLLSHLGRKVDFTPDGDGSWTSQIGVRHLDDRIPPVHA
jgi:hypothetical protein